MNDERSKTAWEKCPSLLTSTEFWGQNSLVRGCPPETPAQTIMKRTKEIKVRMTEEEFDRVTELAQATVLSREEFIREALRGTTIRERPPAEYGEIVRELRRIGSNVHQLLLKARTLDFVDEIMLQETVDAIRRMDRVFTGSFS